MHSFLLYLILVFWICRVLWLRYFCPLSAVPGPALAGITSLWKWHVAWTSRFPWTNADLHAKHGPLVRIGPAHVSASSPEAIHAIYVERKGYAKSAIYNIFQPHFEGLPLHNVFSTQDVEYHTGLKRRIGVLYAMSSVQALEPAIDRAITAFITRMSRFATDRTPVDMSAWLQYYTFDAQGEMNFSSPIGFIEAGEDVGGFCHLDHHMMVYFATWGQILGLEKLKTQLFSLFQSPEPNPLFEFTLKKVQERLRKPADKIDFLGKLVELHQNDAEKLSVRELLAAVYINIVTGHDVTAIQLRAMVYHVARSPQVAAKLLREIAEAEEAGKLSSPVQYTEAASLPYLSAVIQETLRIHPSAGLTLERVVPPGGMVLHDTFIPAGSTIGVNGWVANRNRDIFGDDADNFRPERWVAEGAEASERLKQMRKNLFTWGAGARSCIGKNMATLQLYKLAVELYRNFEIKLARPEMEWRVVGGWLTRQSEMDMVVTPR